MLQYSILCIVMKTTAAITSKFQIHIPTQVREQVGIYKTTQAEIWAEDGVIKIKPKKQSILNYAGKFANRKPVGGKKINLDQIRDEIDYSEL